MRYSNKYRSSKPSQQNYGSNWRDKSRQIREDCNWRCANCGYIAPVGLRKYMHSDHVVPLSKGGYNSKSNIKCLCAECHWLKHISNDKLKQIAIEFKKAKLYANKIS